MSKTYLGDWLAKLFSWMGFNPKPGCGCERRKQTLNNIHKKAEAAVLRRRAK